MTVSETVDSKSQQKPDVFFCLPGLRLALHQQHVTFGSELKQLEKGDIL